jgi:hypothetical protein
MIGIKFIYWPTKDGSVQARVHEVGGFGGCECSFVFICSLSCSLAGRYIRASIASPVNMEAVFYSETAVRIFLTTP